jgi:hypothetical protein
MKAQFWLEMPPKVLLPNWCFTCKFIGHKQNRRDDCKLVGGLSLNSNSVQSIQFRNFWHPFPCCDQIVRYHSKLPVCMVRTHVRDRPYYWVLSN